MTDLVDFSSFSITIHENGKSLPAVSDISFTMKRGEIAALVGESGCGKTISALSLIGLGNANAEETGSLRFDGLEFVGMESKAFLKIRGKRVSMIFQEPMSALNPLMKVGKQISEALCLHQDVSKKQAYSRVLEMMAKVGLADAERIYSCYPHQLSGGQRQRIMIAMAFINDPELIIADEPTTALDVTVEAQIMDIMRRMSRENNTAILLISHDLSVIRDICSMVHVMYSGIIVESGDADQVLGCPLHPYTRALLDAIPSRGRPLVPISGALPSLEERVAKGCPFAPRCPRAYEACFLLKPNTYVTGNRKITCLRKAEELMVPISHNGFTPLIKQGIAHKALLEVCGLKKTFKVGRNRITAVDDVSFDIRKGETLGLVGESGCGKSTTGNLLVRLLSPDGGKVMYRGADISSLSGSCFKPYRKKIQMVFQDPYGSISPKKRIGWLLEEPLKIHFPSMDGKERKKRVLAMLEDVGLDASFSSCSPSSLSGGQRQRVAIALALIAEPEFVVLDEPVSALDVSVQAQILALLLKLGRDRGLTYLFISHDLSVVSYMSDRIAVMYLGRIVEIGDAELIASRPVHPYTKALFSASSGSKRMILEGEVPSPVSPPEGCAFHTRCKYACAQCGSNRPSLEKMDDGRFCACHLKKELV